MSNTPLVKTIGRGSAATRAASSDRGHSLSRKVVIVACIVACASAAARGPRIDWREPLPGTRDDHPLRIQRLELLRQGQDGAAREGHSVRRGGGRDGQQG